MSLAGAPRDFYTQLLACSSSQSVVSIACCLRASLCFVFSACTMTARRTNNSLAAHLDGENSSADTLLPTESPGPSSLASVANTAPQTSSTASAPVVHDPALIAAIVDAVKASLVAEKDAGSSASNLRGNVASAEPQAVLGAFPPHRPACHSKWRPFSLLEAPFRCNRRYPHLQPRKVGLILLCHPLLPLLQPRARRF